MRGLLIGAVAAGLVFSFGSRAGALTTAFVNFETNPSIPQGPALYKDASSAQTVPVPGVATFTGGIVLGNETNLPALSFGTAPNVYGTAEAALVDSTLILPDQVTIAIDPSYTVDEVSFPLFNGAQTVVSYTIDAFNGATQIGQQILSNLPSNDDSGHGVVDLKAPDITSVVITPSNTTVWDYSIDSVAFNEAVSSAITPGGTSITQGGSSSAVPLPPAADTGAAMLAVLGGIALARSRRRNMKA